MRKKALFICNTMYQVICAMWIYYTLYWGEDVDFWISDHTKGAEKVVSRINENGPTHIRAYHVKTNDYSYVGLKRNRAEYLYYRINPKAELRRLVDTKFTYDEIYIANLVDRFVKLAINAYGHSLGKKPQLVLFEEGTSTYSKIYEADYLKSVPYEGEGIKADLVKRLFRDYSIKTHLHKALVFNPEYMEWNCGETVKLKKIDINDKAFVEILNNAFGYTNEVDEYKGKKYIFFEESYYADGIDVDDIGLVRRLSEVIGKKNIIIKIHPRNYKNRFQEEGFITNTNTTIPWEIICINMKDISQKKLITIGSGSILSPAMFLGIPIDAYSLYEVVKNERGGIGPKSDQYWQTLKKNYNLFPNMIKVCKSLDEVYV